MIKIDHGNLLCLEAEIFGFQSEQSDLLFLSPFSCFCLQWTPDSTRKGSKCTCLSDSPSNFFPFPCDPILPALPCSSRSLTALLPFVLLARKIPPWQPSISTFPPSPNHPICHSQLHYHHFHSSDVIPDFGLLFTCTPSSSLVIWGRGTGFFDFSFVVAREACLLSLTKKLK